MTYLSKLSVGLSLLSVGLFSHATAPLFDDLIDGASSGLLFAEKCCGVELPRTERLIELRKAQNCSAIGGPVGEYELRDEKLFLVKLRACSGTIPLTDLFPGMAGPIEANWLDGQFTAVMDRACWDSKGTNLYKTTIKLSVLKGKVVQKDRSTNDLSDCRK